MARLALVLALLLSSAAFAVEPDEILPDPALEARARALSAGLRCLICQNQSIDDSGAPLAKDLRVLLRERLEAGDSDEEVRAYLVDRYGEFVLLRPTFGPANLILWLTPLGVLGAGAFYLWRRRAADARSPAEGLTVEEERALAEALREEG